jgi:hypothetical protein
MLNSLNLRHPEASSGQVFQGGGLKLKFNHLSQKTH